MHGRIRLLCVVLLHLTAHPCCLPLLPAPAGKVMKFVEKPISDDLDSFKRDVSKAQPGQEFLANMGVYVFKREALFKWVLGSGGCKRAGGCCRLD